LIPTTTMLKILSARDSRLILTAPNAFATWSSYDLMRLASPEEGYRVNRGLVQRVSQHNSFSLALLFAGVNDRSDVLTVQGSSNSFRVSAVNNLKRC
jgi:hypothetical protein